MRRTSLDCIYELAKLDERVVFIGSDLGVGVLEEMKSEFPDRWYMEGVAEQHIVGMAAGLAMEGFVPYVNTIATFLTRRCFEQIVIDLSMHRLPVRLIGNGGGGVYAPLGPTHQAIDDIAIMRVIPNMTIVVPCDADEMRRLMQKTLSWPGPVYIRLAKGGETVVSRSENGFEIGKGILMRTPGDVLFITTGVMTQKALEAADILAKNNITSGVLHFHTVKPLDRQLLLESIANVRLVVTVEEHLLAGGLGSAVLETLNDLETELNPVVKRFGIPDSFADVYGSQESLFDYWGLKVDSLVTTVKEIVFEERK